MLSHEHSTGSPIKKENDDTLSTTIERAHGGDSQAFAHLFEHYTTGICTYLARMVGNTEEGRDLAQEAFLRAWRTLPSLQDNTHFAAWLYRIATNIALDYLRQRRLRWLLWPIPGQDEQMRHLPSHETVERVAEVEQIQQAMSKITPKYRACLLLQIVGGFSQREIAELLSIREKSVSIYVKRGSEQFRQAYSALDGVLEIQ